MSVHPKHIATFLLGAAAGLAAAKYMSMTPEEKEKLANDVKDKANQFKNEAEAFAEKAKDYFEELKTKGGEALKDNLADAEKMMNDLFGKKDKTESKPL